MDQYINNLIQQYLNASSKLKKFERVIFKRFSPNIADDVSNEFHRLAIRFEECSLYQYAGMCYLGCSKCQKSLANSGLEIDYYLKSARAFVKANDEEEKLNLKSSKREFLEGALKSYHSALLKLSDESAMKAALIREMKSICPTFEGFSNFSSPCHRIYDLEISAFDSIDSAEFLQALEKLTDIFDNITERRKEQLYLDVLNRIEILRILLLLILDLPPSRQSPSHIKLMQKYSATNNEEDLDSTEDLSDFFELNIPNEIVHTLKSLVTSWINQKNGEILTNLNELSSFESLGKYQRKLVDYLITKYFI